MSKVLDPLAAAQRALSICFDKTMESAFFIGKLEGRTKAATKEEFFGFTCRDVVDVYSHRQGYGFGTFFRLRDGRIYDHMAQPSDGDLTLYDATTH
jgi:hypothetical protein